MRPIEKKRNTSSVVVFRRIFLVVCAGVMIQPSMASSARPGVDERSKGEAAFSGFTIFLDQDWLDQWRNEDRNYTLGLGLSFSGSFVSRTRLAKANRFLFNRIEPEYKKTLLTKHDLVILGSAFTPEDLASSKAIKDDRPYGSILGISSRRLIVPIHKVKLQPGQPPGNTERYPVAIRTEIVIGALGLGVASSTQKGIHKLLDDTPPKGWDNQISDGGEPTLLVRAAYERRISDGLPCWLGKQTDCRGPELYTRRNLEATAFGEATAGYFTAAAGGLRARIGFFNSEFWDFDGAPLSSISQGVQNNLRARSGFELFGFVGVGGRLVGYNALLQGALRDSRHTVDASDIKRAIGEFQIGGALTIPFGSVWKMGAGYLWSGRTAEFSGPQERKHTYGSAFVTIGRVPKI